MSNKIFKIGDSVKLNCFDRSSIIIKITSIENEMVYGISNEGTSHWGNIKDIESI